MPKSAKRVPYRTDLDKISLYYARRGKEIRDLLLSINPAEFSELESTGIQVKIDKIVRDLNRYAIGFSQKAIKKAYLGTYKDTKLKLQILKFKPDPEFDPEIHIQYIKENQDLMAKDLLKANASIKQEVSYYIHMMRMAHKGLSLIQAWDMRDEKVISKLLDKGVKAGDSRGQVQKSIKNHFKKRFGDAKFININGRNYDLRKYSKMVARTRIRVMQTQAVEESMLEYNADLVQISRHGTVCDICGKYEGNVYSQFGKTPGFPVLPRGVPPWHPNCEHNKTPTSKEALWQRERYKYEAPPGATMPGGLPSLADYEARLLALGIEANLAGLSLEMAHMVYKEIARLMKKYKGLLVKIATVRGMKKNAYAQVWASRNMDLNLNWFENPERFLAQLKRDMASGFHPSGVDFEDLFRSVIGHEYGHTLYAKWSYDKAHPLYRELKSIKSDYSRMINQKQRDFWKTKSDISSKYQYKMDQAKTLAERADLELQRSLEMSKATDRYNQWKNNNYLSDYAKENLGEFYAEAFMASELSKSPVPVAQTVGEFSKKHWGTDK